MTLDEDILIVCAFRYCLGRMTYVVNAFARNFHKKWDDIPYHTKDLVVREILEHKEKFGKLGHDCDEEDWMSIVERFNDDKREGRNGQDRLPNRR